MLICKLVKELQKNSGMKDILVYADWHELPSMMLLGNLRAEISRGEEIFSFEYTQKWLDSGYAQDLDPDLQMFRGSQFLKDDKTNFGLFLDSSPDRWGRMLMKRRSAIHRREQGEKTKNLLESDFLLGVSDETRMGGLRFKLKGSGTFLESTESVKVPPMTHIRELEQASLKIEENEFASDSEAKKWLNMMMTPGSSLGGARPKASVRDTDGSLWIAKFPSKNDDRDSGIWEYLVNDLAKRLSIHVAQVNAVKYSQSQHTFLSKRFDRSSDNKRIHFASAMTLLGYKDGYSHKEGGSYLELVGLIERYGANPTQDLLELWRRIVFSVAVSNTDDHLRNHGFILSRQGWFLSPAYDINPNESGYGLSLNISENDNSLSFDLCLSVAEYFRWNPKDAKTYIQKVKTEVSKWHSVATSLNISKNEQAFMENAFNTV